MSALRYLAVQQSCVPEMRTGNSNDLTIMLLRSTERCRPAGDKSNVTSMVTLDMRELDL
jgi:hypothetical protein